MITLIAISIGLIFGTACPREENVKEIARRANKFKKYV